jgi:hypothetical protein
MLRANELPVSSLDQIPIPLRIHHRPMNILIGDAFPVFAIRPLIPFAVDSKPGCVYKAAYPNSQECAGLPRWVSHRQTTQQGGIHGS